jgi:anti-sigma-K factor RskA
MSLSPAARKLLSSAIAELQKINDRIQSHENAVRDTAKAYEKQQPPSVVVNVPERVSVKKDEEDSKQDSVYHSRNFWVQVALTAFTAAAFAAAAYYACIAKRQWKTMNDTYKEIQQQTIAAQSTLAEVQQQTKMIRQQLIGTSAASIDIQVEILEDASSGPRIDFRLLNIGHVIASNIRVKTEVQEIELPSMRLIREAGSFNFTVPELIPQTRQIAFGQNIRWDSHSHYLEISKDLLNLIYETKRSFRIKGVLSYYDGFQEEQIPVCYALIGAQTLIKKRLMEHATVRCEDVASELQSLKSRKEAWKD